MGRVGSELLRKSVHIGMGGVALTLRWLTPTQAALLALTALLFNLFVLHRLTRRTLLREGEKASGFSWGIALYPAAVLALILVFHRRLELAAAIWGFVAFGDGMASVVGVLVGGPKLPWNRGKSWSGFFAFVLYATAASTLLIRWTQRAVLDNAGGTAVDWVGGSFLASSSSGAFLADPLFLAAGCFAAALAAGLAESLDTGIDDNVLVPLVGAPVLYAATLVEPARLAAAAQTLRADFVVGAAVNLVLALGAYAARGVGRSGAIWGWVLGTALFGLSGWRGFLMLFVFFVLGTATTKLGYKRKAALGIAQSKGGRRGARNAFANSGAGVIFAFLALATAFGMPFTVALVAAFATAACDTVSSEFGQAYGRHHYLVTTFRPVKAGTDGAVSLEGTLAGIVGAGIVALVAWLVGLIPGLAAVAVTAGGWFGATFESYLGATIESRLRLDNELVNFTNTLVGGLSGLAIYALFS